jgi:hypothetical protein
MRRSFAAVARDVVDSYTIQLQHLIWPLGLLPSYPRVAGEPAWWQIVSVSATLLVLGVCAFRLTARGTLARLGLLLAATAYLPASNLVPNLRLVADSYLYLPLAGLGLWLVSLGEGLWPRALARVSRPAWVALALALGLLAFVQTDVWSSSANLWRPVMARYPDQPVPLARFAIGLLHDGQRERAAKAMVLLRQRFPSYEEAICDQAWAYAELGDRVTATSLLERGVKLRRGECVRVYLSALVAGPLPGPEKKELVQIAVEEALAHLRPAPEQTAYAHQLARLAREIGLARLAERASAFARECASR